MLWLERGFGIVIAVLTASVLVFSMMQLAQPF